jgi:hypothetical protein
MEVTEVRIQWRAVITAKFLVCSNYSIHFDQFTLDYNALMFIDTT